MEFLDFVVLMGLLLSWRKIGDINKYCIACLADLEIYVTLCSSKVRVCS